MPFGLTAPARLLMPNMHKHRNYRQQTVALGEDARLTVSRWDRCDPACHGGPMGNHDAGWDVRLHVLCDARPHCQSCECLGGHEVVLSAAMITSLKEMLP